MRCHPIQLVRIHVVRRRFVRYPKALIAAAAFVTFLPGLARAQAPSMVRFQEKFSPDDLSLEETLLPDKTKVTRVRLRGATETGQAGFPILPCIVRHVALPRGAKILGLTVDPGQQVTMQGHPVLEWQRGEQPGGQGQREPKPPEYEQTPDGPLYYPPDERAVPLDPSLQQFSLWPPQAAAITPSTESGGYEVIAGYDVIPIKIFPVQWASRSGLLSLSQAITVGINFSGGTVPDPKRRDNTSLSELEALRGLVVNANDVPDIAFAPIPEDLDAWHLIITDNFKWNENRTKGVALSGDMVEEFERLAEWKTQKGVLSAVVTVSDILDGVYGNFNPPGTRDLQEVLRNFIKHARSEFHTYWVLLGGDVSVIPPRSVAAHTGYGDHFIPRKDASKPEKNECYWDAAGQRVRIHCDYATASLVFAARATGKAFSKVASPSAGSPGWTFATSDSYATFTGSETDYVVLVGPLADTENADFYAIRDLNTIPTDLYYSSVDSPLYGQAGKHDWDLNGNSLYGQYFEGDSIDGVDYWADLGVGRAPVESGTEAAAFVNKVIAYEKYDGLPVSFGRKLLLGSSNWGGGPAVSSGGASPPDEGLYYSAPGSTSSNCHFKGPPDTGTGYDLVAYDAPGDHWYVPYNKAASSSTLGYFFCTSDTYATVSEFSFSFWGLTIEFPIPTKYVKVKGPSGQVHPVKFFFDSVEPDSSVVEKEQVKDIFAAEFPEMSTRKRLYADLEDTPGYPDPDLFELSEPAMQAELNSGYNIVSLSGHGSPGGCCRVSSSYVDDLTNGFKGGIVYAESCSTNRFPDSDAVSEVFLKTAAGGAMAYVGNSRYSWVGAGDDLERIFWNRLRTDRHVARLHNSKASLADSNAHRWAQFALNLVGDPETPLWVGSPEAMDVDHPTCVVKGSSFEVTVTTSGGAPITFARVCLTGPRDIFELHYTGVTGQTTFFTADKELGDELVITVTKDDRIPHKGTVLVSSRCSRLFIRGDTTFDGKLDISDAIAGLNFLFTGGKAPPCDDAADTNDDGKIDLSDSIRLLGYLFLGDRLPPGTTPGKPQEDTTEDRLGCEATRGA